MQNLNRAMQLMHMCRVLLRAGALAQAERSRPCCKSAHVTSGNCRRQAMACDDFPWAPLAAKLRLSLSQRHPSVGAPSIGQRALTTATLMSKNMPDTRTLLLRRSILSAPCAVVEGAAVWPLIPPARGQAEKRRRGPPPRKICAPQRRTSRRHLSDAAAVQFSSSVPSSSVGPTALAMGS